VYRVLEVIVFSLCHVNLYVLLLLICTSHLGYYVLHGAISTVLMAAS